MAHIPNMPDKYYQGRFTPKNRDKYLGNADKIYYRSSWEKKFMIYCDTSQHIIKWGSEIIPITYVYESKDKNGILKPSTHKYLPDFYIETNNSMDNKYLIEIKPWKETQPPKPPKNNNIKALKNYELAVQTFVINNYKWEYAKEWCNKRGIKYMILTEKDLFSYKK